MWKKQKRVGSMEALNNHGFMIFNRNSQIFDYSRGNAIEENIYDEIRREYVMMLYKNSS